MNIKITFFLIYIVLLYIVIFKDTTTKKKEIIPIKNTKLYNEIQKKLYNENFINIDVENSSNKYIRYIYTLFNKIHNIKEHNNKILKNNNVLYDTDNKIIKKLQTYHNINYMAITTNLQTIKRKYNTNFTCIILSKDNFKIKYKNNLYNTNKCYFNSELDTIQIEIKSPILFVEIKKYENIELTKLNKIEI